MPYTWFNLGIYYKRAGDFDKALVQFQQMAKLVPSEPITHYNLGTIYKLENKLDLARQEFELARDLGPSLAAPHFQLFNRCRQEGRMADAQRELKFYRPEEGAGKQRHSERGCGVVRICRDLRSSGSGTGYRKATRGIFL